MKMYWVAVLLTCAMVIESRSISKWTPLVEKRGTESKNPREIEEQISEDVQNNLGSYQPPIALQMVYMAGISYENPLLIDSWTCSLCKEYKIQFPKPFFNQTTNVHGFSGYSSPLNAIIVSFRGADSVATWVPQIKPALQAYSRCPDCQVNSDFRAKYQSVKAGVLAQVDALRKLFRNAKLYCVGHGYGGALTQLTALDLKQIYSDTITVHTFGSPRLGNVAFAAFYSAEIADNYGVINNADVVPHLPPMNLSYDHANFEVWYPDQMQSYRICKGDQSDCSDSIPTASLSLTDNAISNYLKLKPS